MKSGIHRKYGDSLDQDNYTTNDIPHTTPGKTISEVQNDRCDFTLRTKVFEGSTDPWKHPSKLTACILPDFDDTVNVVQTCMFGEEILPLRFCDSGNSTVPEQNWSDTTYDRGSSKCSEIKNRGSCAYILEHSSKPFSMPEDSSL